MVEEMKLLQTQSMEKRAAAIQHGTLRIPSTGNLQAAKSLPLLCL